MSYSPTGKEIKSQSGDSTQPMSQIWREEEPEDKLMPSNFRCHGLKTNSNTVSIFK